MLTLKNAQIPPPFSPFRFPLNPIILINKPDIPRPLRVPPHKLLVSRRPLRLLIPRQHALNTHAHALDVLHRAPALVAEEIEADDAVAVDVGMKGDGARGLGEGKEGDFGCF